MTSISDGKKRAWRITLVVSLVLALLGGLYILALVLSPSLVTMPGADNQVTQQRLNEQPGKNGNRLYLPQINVDVAIVTGSDESVLEQGAWHRKPENGNPVDGGNFVLSAHRFTMGITPQQTRAKSPFYNIDKLQVGEQIFVDYEGDRYGYEITKKEQVKPDQVEIEEPSEEPKLTLYSCTLQGAADGREVIIAKPIGRVDKVEISSRTP